MAMSVFAKHLRVAAVFMQTCRWWPLMVSTRTSVALPRLVKSSSRPLRWVVCLHGSTSFPAVAIRAFNGELSLSSVGYEL